MALGKIKVEDIDDMTEIVAGLVRQAICFEVYKENGYYVIELSGGC